MPEEVSRFGKLHEPTTIILTTNIGYFTNQYSLFYFPDDMLPHCQRASFGMRKGINGNVKGHQWECERTSMGMRKGINGNAKGHQWECKRTSMGMRKDINGNAKRHQWECERASMGMRKGINGHTKRHQWECERASMGMRKDINGKGNYKLFDPSCQCLPAPVGEGQGWGQ